MKVGQKNKSIFLILPEELHRKLKLKAYSEGKNIKEVLLELIEKYVKKGGV